ncbi:unnamed protein product [Urochloa decumbens]|uniref:Sialate O-acetylesterase domain-containing protein n=1 Tax=Urochloa decumbens TaxID=240449 RepID=A0ABC9BL51_9POAL
MAPARVLVVFLLMVAAGEGAASQSQQKVAVFLLAGQSNMGGRGGATSGTWDGVVPPECAPSPRILRLSPDLSWEEAREPLHAGIDNGNVVGVGPGMPFAHAVSSSRHAHAAAVGLVPCAQGGTPISAWSRGSPLYQRLLWRARAALAAHCPEAIPNCSLSLAALLWYQGEADTMARRDADLYTARMEAFVRDIRNDLNMPNLLVIQVGLATGQGPFIDLVRDAQKRVNLPNVKYVDAKGLPVATDYLHLTTPAQVTLGNMLANSYLATL